jgi:hypothetical protein
MLWLGNFRGAVYRAGGVIGNSGAYGQLTAIFGILLAMAGAVGLRLSPALRGAGWVMVVAAFLVSSSRGGMVMLIIGLMVIGALNIRLAIGYAATGVISVVTLLLLVFVVGSENQQAFFWLSLSRLDFLNLTGESQFAQTVRLQTWAQLWPRLFDIPLFGYGYKSFEEYYGQFVDNSFMLAWIETGPLGFMLFTMFWILLSIRLLADWFTFRHPLTLAALGLLAGFLVRMQTGGAHSSWSDSPLVFLLMGLALRVAAMKREAAARRMDRRLEPRAEETPPPLGATPAE